MYDVQLNLEDWVPTQVNFTNDKIFYLTVLDYSWNNNEELTNFSFHL